LRRSAIIITVLVLASASFGLAHTLRWMSHRDLTSLDPHAVGDSFTIAALNHVYEGLVRYDEHLRIEPALATSWAVADDGMTWTFQLRQGVTFHDGRPFTADDVVASLRRATHETSRMRGNLPAYRASRALDVHTVEIVVAPSYPLLLNDLTNAYVFSASWLAEHEAELPTDVAAGLEGYPTRHANGTGPFMLESRRQDARTVFVTNPDWWDEPRHNLTRIEFEPVTTDATRVAAMLTGTVDFTNAAPLQDLARLEADPDIVVRTGTELRTAFFLFSKRDRLHGQPDAENPFRDVRIREAMNLAIDIEQIHLRVMRGLSRVTGSLVAPAIPGYVPELDVRLPFDPARAATLVAEAGYPDGFSFTLLCAADGLVNEAALCQAAAAMWSRLGLSVDLDVAPTAQVGAKARAGAFDVVMFGWANEPMIDAYSILVQLLHTPSGSAGVFNFGEWGDPRIDALADASVTELDRERRLGLLAEALAIAKDEVLYVPLHQQPTAWATSTRVERILQLPDNKPRLWHTRVRE
jgi:peptide/nickel transport system substrate-binding protein